MPMRGVNKREGMMTFGQVLRLVIRQECGRITERELIDRLRGTPIRRVAAAMRLWTVVVIAGAAAMVGGLGIVARHARPEVTLVAACGVLGTLTAYLMRMLEEAR
jgi:hypothetical protein